MSAEEMQQSKGDFRQIFNLVVHLAMNSVKLIAIYTVDD